MTFERVARRAVEISLRLAPLQAAAHPCGSVLSLHLCLSRLGPSVGDECTEDHS